MAADSVSSILAFRLTSNGTQIPLEPRPFRLLLYLIQNSHRLVRKQEILDTVWQDAAVTDAALTRSIGLLRKALGDDSRARPGSSKRFLRRAIALLPGSPCWNRLRGPHYLSSRLRLSRKISQLPAPNRNPPWRIRGCEPLQWPALSFCC